jgi:hypothetical protein
MEVGRSGPALTLLAAAAAPAMVPAPVEGREVPGHRQRSPSSAAPTVGESGPRIGPGGGRFLFWEMDGALRPFAATGSQKDGQLPATSATAPGSDVGEKRHNMYSNAMPQIENARAAGFYIGCIVILKVLAR